MEQYDVVGPIGHVFDLVGVERVVRHDLYHRKDLGVVVAQNGNRDLDPVHERFDKDVLASPHDLLNRLGKLRGLPNDAHT